MTKDSKKVYVCQLNEKQIAQLRDDLTKKDFEFYDVSHALFGARQNYINLTLYKSHKLVIQGKQAKEFVEFYIEPELLKNFSISYKELIEVQDFEEHIGVDESGKGDYFGPLVIAGAYVEENQASDLIKHGIKDCKKLSDKKVNELYTYLRKKTKYSLVTIGPERYNELYEKMSNLNKILAWGHARAIENLLLKVKCDKVILDKFSNKTLVSDALMKRGRKVRIEQRTHAEEDIIVAAASILARGEFLLRINQLEKQFKIKLPRGAGKIVEDAAAEIIEKEGMSILTKIAKLHFRTTKKVIMS